MRRERHVFKTVVGDQEIVIETGYFAWQANGAVIARIGDTMILATATMAKEPREGIDFFPLSVDFEERLYAAGRIPGSFQRREGKPSENAILTARLVDRPLRPLFPKDLRNEVQIILTSLSADPEYHLDIPSIIAASAALTISDIPWFGPIGAVRVGYIDGQFVINPTVSQMEHSQLDLRLAGTADAVIMVEAGANEIPEDRMVEAIRLGHEALQPLIALQEEMRAAIGKPKASYRPFTISEEVRQAVRARLNHQIAEILDTYFDKDRRNEALDELEEEVLQALAEYEQAQVKESFHEALREEVRRRILEEGRRPDGRRPKDIRPIWCEVDVSPRAHGSAIFTRGDTQVLSVATLATLSEQQELDTLAPEETKRYIHHYNFPPFSTGEVRVLRGASRREIGHGALAERALLPVIPPEEEFPYTIRVVSEVLSSNGSTSMASVCGSTLALMDAGVPIRKPVSGVAMGLVTSDEAWRKYVILTDIQGMEDHLGDMDFKVAGTADGITALQMDVKIKGLPYSVLAEALHQAREARLFILEKMLEVLPAPRPELKPHAPRIFTVHIPTEKIGALIGPGGKTIRKIQEETHTQIDIEEDGTVRIAATSLADAESARLKIEAYAEEPQVGKIYLGKVIRITDFGAFVEILPGEVGMVHISQIADQKVNRIEDVVRVGDQILVMVTHIDEDGKIRLSRQAVLEGLSVEEAQQRDRLLSGKAAPKDKGRPGEERPLAGRVKIVRRASSER
ncbi:polyribonucleotide nucleotidyltransferase [Thermoflexus sp.]|uniref:polyribonucleotide nucleotidyltransferase n=1 Tax=Thermoflexus sp. TaxID=1969742 RepID=UPI0025FAC3AB|nr:polyribonucleotide nucleotidyltransferase [Thermoflexus sp.]MDW8181525.1 polyribonucleotide nucleotidyltransferase [Anaerolineae bacterium]MCS6963823.1 polyribonucleotide nucleotidyltransferase [Thermoflexus sp.]MCS7352066.1 polyribonucleotide nucleotidyltransferase [Thermoflexus sp.]MCX7691453.1 polyribonucleotide nucleotidyltransferase [Thermoflexus sp.]MDW8184972.1 polyribonucleotide nucleotidyltransferase [Anaerolineae bacterium]